MTTTFKAYREIEFPKWAIDFGFIDVSWGNDAAARAIWPLSSSEAKPLFLELWVDYEDPERREVPSWPRFVAGLNWEEGSDGFLVNIYHGEDEAACHYLVEKFIALLKRRS